LRRASLLCAARLCGGLLPLLAGHPVVGNMFLPLLGGTPAFWSTGMVFFQTALLGGYAYAHASATWLGASRQAVLHLLLLVLPLAVLPLGIDPGRVVGGEANPVLGGLLLLSGSGGLP